MSQVVGQLQLTITKIFFFFFLQELIQLPGAACTPPTAHPLPAKHHVTSQIRYLSRFSIVSEVLLPQVCFHGLQLLHTHLVAQELLTLLPALRNPTKSLPFALPPSELKLAA